MRAQDAESLRAWARFWRQWVSSAFLRAYHKNLRDASLVPAERADAQMLMSTLLLEKHVYGLGYELIHRTQAVPASLRAVLEQLHGQEV